MEGSVAMKSSWSEMLSGLDAGFLHLEDRTTHMHVGSVSVFEGPAPGYQELLRHIASRLHLIPRYRQRLAFVPLQLGRPSWVDDAKFDLAFHVRHAAVPSPGGDEELKALASRLFAQSLDLERPLWELYLVEGLSGGRFAIITKNHHCMVDGVAGVDLGTLVLDAVAATEPTPAPRDWRARPAPSRRALVAGALRDPVRRTIDLARGALTPKSEARSTLALIAGGVAPMIREASRARQTPASSLNQPLGLHRRYETLSLDLAAIKQVGGALGGKVNDVVLAVVAGGLRRLLIAREEPLEDLRVMVPVNIRSANHSGGPGNHVATYLCALPVRCVDPLERLRAVATTMSNAKKSRQHLGAMAASSLSEFYFAPLAASATRLSMRSPWFNLVVTNVPGPQMPLYLLGHRLVHCFPMVPLAQRQALGIALLSYNGAIGVGLLGDADRMPDLAVLAEAMKEELDELVKLARLSKASPNSSVSPNSPLPRKSAQARAETAIL